MSKPDLLKPCSYLLLSSIHTRLCLKNFPHSIFLPVEESLATTVSNRIVTFCSSSALTCIIQKTVVWTPFFPDMVKLTCCQGVPRLSLLQSIQTPNLKIIRWRVFSSRLSLTCQWWQKLNVRTLHI